MFVSSSRDSNTIVPPCPADLSVDLPPSPVNGDDADGPSTSAGAPSSGTALSQAQSDRLLAVCREYSALFKECQEKYHELIYATAEKVLRNSQASQLKQLKQQLEKKTSDVMRQLNVARRAEVKTLAMKHKDRDELVR